MLLSKGNHKLPNTTLIWNLPSGLTCPNQTESCKKWCYAKKAERVYPQVLPFRMNNFRISKQLNFIELIVDDIAQHDIRDRNKCNTIRLHESGDFYNQEYLDSWIHIAKHFPTIVFYAYTKSIMLDYSKRPFNFIVLLSDDEEKYKKQYKRFDGITKVIEKNKDIFSLARDDFITCCGSCKECNYCYNNDGQFKRIVFHKH
jgi:hypothetical protein